MVGAGDTIELSKSFGIVRFPMLYGKTGTIIVGIERRYSYDSCHFTEKSSERMGYVPIAGDIFAAAEVITKTLVALKPSVLLAQHVVNSKTVTRRVIYDVDVYIENRIEAFSSQPIYCGNLTHTNTIVSFGNLTSDDRCLKTCFMGKLYHGVGEFETAQSFDFGPYVSSGSFKKCNHIRKGPSGEICKVYGL